MGLQKCLKLFVIQFDSFPCTKSFGADEVDIYLQYILGHKITSVICLSAIKQVFVVHAACDNLYCR